MTKKIQISLIANSCIFGGALLLTQSFNMMIFIGMIYLIPIGLNYLLDKKEASLKEIISFSTITTVGYGAFSYLFMQQAAFENFIATTQTAGDLSFQVQGDLLSASQIAFVFIMNTVGVYLLTKFVGRKNYVASQRA